MFTIRATIACLIMIIAASGAFAAPVIIFKASTSDDDWPNQDRMVGWGFTALAEEGLTVTGLGWYDYGGDGLSHEHLVGIWDFRGNLLASALVPSGKSAPLEHMYRQVEISPIELLLGRFYYIGGLDFADSTDRIAVDVDRITSPDVVYASAYLAPVGGGFQWPNLNSPPNTVHDNGFYGPMFFIPNIPKDWTIPEPATFTLVGAGLAGLGLMRRKRRIP
jgi:hypothetical protein